MNKSIQPFALMASCLLFVSGCATKSVVFKSDPPGSMAPYPFKFYVTEVFSGVTGTTPIARGNSLAKPLATSYPDWFSETPERAMPVMFTIQLGQPKLTRRYSRTFWFPYMLSLCTLPASWEEDSHLLIEAKCGDATSQVPIESHTLGFLTAYTPIGLMMPYLDDYDCGVTQIANRTGIDQALNNTMFTTDGWRKHFVYALKKLDRVKIQQSYEKLNNVPKSP
jgi:hypothetical protein